MALPPASTVVVAVHPTAALGPLRWSDLVTEWRIDPLLLALLIAAGAGYAWYRMRGRRLGIAWPKRRDVTFAIGLVAAFWVSCGTVQVRAARIEWVWVAQLLALLLVVPFLLLGGQPIELARRVGGERSPVGRVADSRAVRAIGNPLIGPALVPMIFAVVLFAGVGQAAASSPVAGWVLQAALLLMGLAIAMPLVDSGQARTSMAIGLALAVGFLELIMDVFPGIAMRLAGHPVIPYFFTHTPGWTAGWLYEQHQAGGLLWIASEILDLPFLILLAVRWVRVDAAEAKRIDAELDAEQARQAAEASAAVPSTPGAPGTVPQREGAPDAGARESIGASVRGASADGGSAVAGSGTEPAADRAGAPARHAPPATSRPWFLDDPQLRDRYRF